MSGRPAEDCRAWSQEQIEAVLGHPLLTDDPMLTTKQAAALLGMSVNRLHYLVRQRRAMPSGRGHRRWRLVDLKGIQGQPPPRKSSADPVHADRLPTDDAAALLGISRRTFHRWAAAGKLPAVRDSRGRWWVRSEDLEAIRRREHDLNPVHAGRVPSAEAAAILGMSPSSFRDAASAGRLPAVKDAAGRWWARPEHLEMMRRARLIEAEQDQLDLRASVPASRRRRSAAT